MITSTITSTRRIHRVLPLLLSTLVLLAFACEPTLAFRSDALNRRGGGMIRTQHAQPKQHSPKQQQHQSSTAARTTRHTTSSSTTRLQASVVQYKNVEQMLDSFRDEPLLIAFTAVNCGPCKLQRAELAHVQKDLNHLKKNNKSNNNQSSSNSKPITMVAIDTDRWPNVGTRFHVGKLPCLVAVQNGQELLRLEGLQSAQEITRQVQTILEKPLQETLQEQQQQAQDQEE